MTFSEWRTTHPDQCLGPGINFAWERYMDSLAPPPPSFRSVILGPKGRDIICSECGGADCGCPACDSVTPVTPAEAVLADTSNNREAIPRPTGDAKMFTSSNFEMNVTKIIAAATLAAFLLSLVA